MRSDPYPSHVALTDERVYRKSSPQCRWHGKQRTWLELGLGLGLGSGSGLGLGHGKQRTSPCAMTTNSSSARPAAAAAARRRFGGSSRGSLVRGKVPQCTATACLAWLGVRARVRIGVSCEGQCTTTAYFIW